MKKVAIVGGGIIGLAIAYKLTLQNKNLEVFLFEKENKLGLHQSGNNSGVLHCGIHYKPGSLKSRLSIDGVKQMKDFCNVNEIEYEICGKILVASSEEEIKTLEKLASYGSENNLNGLKFLSKNELLQREPNVHSLKTLLIPEEGIVSYPIVLNKFAEHIQSNKGKIFLNTKICGVKEVNNEIILNSKDNEWTVDTLINCSGLQSDKNFKTFTKEKSPLSIIPFRGEYLKLKKEYTDLFNHLIYPVPNMKFPFLGIHFTRMISGEKEVGPNAVLALKREGYKPSQISLKDSFEILSNKGLINFLSKNFNFSINEFKSSLNKREFTKKAKRLIPDIEEYMLEKGGAGIRAQAISPEGELLMDFNIIQKKNQIHVLNAPSPGATSSLAIADYVINNYKI